MVDGCLPVVIDKVLYSDNKFDFSVVQAEFFLNKVPEGYTIIIVGDSTYSCNKFIHNISKLDNATVITRMRGNKAMYEKYEDKKKGLALKIRLSLFKSYICRGSKDYAMSYIPINFIRA